MFVLLSDLEAIYLRLPIPLQHLACTFVGWRTRRTRYGGEFAKILADAQARTYWSVEDVGAFRNRRLSELVAHSAATVPFYRDRLRSAGISPSQVETIDDLARLPILTKAEAQEHAIRLVSTAVPTHETHMVHTSGTTGGALRFPVTMRTVQEQWAIWWRYRGWHGIRSGTWCALFGGRSVVPSRQSNPPFWRVNLVGRQLLFSGYHMSPENLSAYVNELRNRRPPWLHGYPSLLALLAAHLVESGSDLGYDVRWVTIGAENLLPHQSTLMERAFGVKPLQHYGLTEGVANISQCELGALHVDEDFAAVEFIPLERNGLHRIVGTNLSNPATPLIRYDSQDFATLQEGDSCSCGRPGRVVERLDGRVEDYVMLRNGARVGRMDHIFKDMVNIQEAQIHQVLPGEITIRVVRSRDYVEEDERSLLRETAKRLGDDMKMKIEYVNVLSRSSIGKLRFVVSEIPEASIEGTPARSPEAARSSRGSES
jgi:phenylacetate-CoA ligase